MTDCSGEAAVLAAVLLGALVAGCAPVGLELAPYPESVRYAAMAESLGLDAYRTLPVPVQDMRRQEAIDRFRAARHATSVDACLRGLHTAVGLQPDLAPAWLELMRQDRWFGDYQRVLEYHAGLRAALATEPPSVREDMLRQAALVLAWLHYDRGEWTKGLAWVDSAGTLESPADQVIRGLLLAGSGQDLYSEDVARNIARHGGATTNVRWIHGMAQWYRGNPGLARAILRHSNAPDREVQPKSGPDAFVPGELRPDPAYAAVCWRDAGTLEEVLGNWNEARRQYERSFAAIGGAKSRGVTRVNRQSMSDLRHIFPIWLAFDRFYVTGSISAYAALAYQRFGLAGMAPDREFWAGAAINAAGICVRRAIDVPWALRVRGLVLIAAGRDAEARPDLEKAWKQLSARGREDFDVAAALGHLYLASGNAEAALPLLRVAARLRPDVATAAADLGLALILQGQLEEALPALNRALATDPQLAVGWYNRGLLYYHSRQWAQAVADLEHAARLLPDDPDLARVLENARRQLRN